MVSTLLRVLYIPLIGLWMLCFDYLVSSVYEPLHTASDDYVFQKRVLLLLIAAGRRLNGVHVLLRVFSWSDSSQAIIFSFSQAFLPCVESCIFIPSHLRWLLWSGWSTRSRPLPCAGSSAFGLDRDVGLLTFLQELATSPCGGLRTFLCP